MKRLKLPGLLSPLGWPLADIHMEILFSGPRFRGQSRRCFSERMTCVPGIKEESKPVSIVKAGIVTVGQIRGGCDTVLLCQQRAALPKWKRPREPGMHFLIKTVSSLCPLKALQVMTRRVAAGTPSTEAVVPKAIRGSLTLR